MLVCHIEMIAVRPNEIIKYVCGGGHIDLRIRISSGWIWALPTEVPVPEPGALH